MSINAGGSSSRSRSRDATPKIFKKQRERILEQLNQRIDGNVPSVQGPFIAPVSAGEQAGLDALQANVFGDTGLGAAQDQYLTQTLTQSGENPFLQATIDAAIRPILENAQLQELRDRSAFAGAGQKLSRSSAFAEDRANAVRDTERAVGDVAAQLAFQEFENRRQQQAQAVELANSRFAEQRQAISTLALPRLVEQYGIEKGNEEMVRRFNVIEAALNQLAQLASPRVVTLSSSSQGNAGIDLGGIGGTSGETP